MIFAGSQVATHWPANAATNLPPRTAAQLLTYLQQARPTALSGTVTADMSLGLPQLPSVSGGNPADPMTLLSGSHTAKVWYDGQRSSRIALLGDSSETDLVTNSTGLWLWQSADKSVLHVAAPPGGPRRMSHGAPTRPNAAGLPAQLSTPEGVSAMVLRMLDPTTSVTTTSNDRVAGRSAYELVLTPKTNATKIGSIRIAIDAAHHIPLRAEVFARGANKPAINVGFTSITFAKPPASRFDFTPPPGAKVTTPKPRTGTHSHKAIMPANRVAPHVVGTGWSSVLVGQVPLKTTANKQGPSSLQGVLGLLPKVSGSWGFGHLLDTPLFSAVITDDGHFAVGAVQPAALYAALGA